MFDIGFWELIVVGIVALVVIGPRQLPSVARSVGVFIARLQKSIQKTKNDFAKEVEWVHSVKQYSIEPSSVKKLVLPEASSFDKMQKVVVARPAQRRDAIQTEKKPGLLRPSGPRNDDSKALL
ncbi:MAG: twin-arginine translocase subunit TatB [Gammaproteobacteria bacterium]|nr:twin-arginine translocase subunit TatB [Gammaproteobacteria bacterium]